MRTFYALTAAALLAPAALTSTASAQVFTDTATVDASITIEQLDTLNVIVERDLDFGDVGFILDDPAASGFYGWAPASVSLTKAAGNFTCTSPAPTQSGVTVRPGVNQPQTGFIQARGTANRSATLQFAQTAGSSQGGDLLLYQGATGGTATNPARVQGFSYYLYEGPSTGLSRLVTDPLGGNAVTTSFDVEGDLALCFFGQLVLTPDMPDNQYFASLNVTIAYD